MILADKQLGVRLLLRGPVPSKKNNLRRGEHGNMFTRGDSTQTIGALIAQARSQYRDEPIARAAVHCTFYVPTGRADGDNKLTTILDVLQKAGIIQNDNALRCPSGGYLCVIGESEERTEVEVWRLPNDAKRRRKAVGEGRG